LYKPGPIVYFDMKVGARCIEARLSSNTYVECFIKRDRIESISIRVEDELVRYEDYRDVFDVKLDIADYVAMALVHGVVRTFITDVLVYDLNDYMSLYIFKEGGHVVVINREWDVWQNYAGKISDPIEELVSKACACPYSKKFCNDVVSALKHAKEHLLKMS